MSHASTAADQTVIAIYSFNIFSAVKNIIEKAWQYGFKLCFLFALMLPVSAGVTAAPTTPEVCVTCQPPTVSKTGQGPKSVSFAWNAVSGATGYRVWYVNKSTDYGSAVLSTGNTSISFSNLESGTYDFYFQTACGDENSEYVVIEDVVII